MLSDDPYWIIQRIFKMVMTGNKVMSAAMALAHEMGHAAQQLDVQNTLIRLEEYEGDHKAKMEAYNFARYEIPIATELGEYTRAF